MRNCYKMVDRSNLTPTLYACNEAHADRLRELYGPQRNLHGVIVQPGRRTHIIVDHDLYLKYHKS